MRNSFAVALLLAVLSAVIGSVLWRIETGTSDTLQLARVGGSAALVAFLAGGLGWKSIVSGRGGPVRGFIAGALTAITAHLLHFYPGLLYVWITGEGSPLDNDPYTHMPSGLAGLFLGSAGIGTQGGLLSILGLGLVGLLLSLKRKKPAPPAAESSPG